MDMQKSERTDVVAFNGSEVADLFYAYPDEFAGATAGVIFDEDLDSTHKCNKGGQKK